MFYPSAAFVNLIIICETVPSAELNEGTRLLNAEHITDSLMTDQSVKFAKIHSNVASAK